MRWWSVLVEVAADSDSEAEADQVDEDVVGDLGELLAAAELHPAVAGGGAHARWSARVSLQAPSAQAAAATAEDRVRAAAARAGLPLDWPTVRLEAITEQELDADLTRPAFPDLAGRREAAALLGVTVARLDDLAATHPRFPEPAIEVAATPLWSPDAVRTFGEAHGTGPPTDADWFADSLAEDAYTVTFDRDADPADPATLGP